MWRACMIVFLANLALVVPATLVPRISNDNGFQLLPMNNQYSLSIRHPDGLNLREETVQEVAPGELEVKGILNQVFEDHGGALLVVYKADRNGYIAKYSYNVLRKPLPPSTHHVLLSSGLLKSTTG